MEFCGYAHLEEENRQNLFVRISTWQQLLTTWFISK